MTSRADVSPSATNESHEAPQHEPDVRRPLGETPHVPGKPRAPVADQNPDHHARGGKRALLGWPDPIEHVDLVRYPGKAPHPAARGDLRDEAAVVCSEDRARLPARRPR